MVAALTLSYNDKVRPLGKIKLVWSSNFAYAIGLITTDGCLYNDGRHLSLTTKDLEQAKNFIHCLGLTVTIGNKSRGYEKEKKYFHVQFGDVLFYRYLESIGLTPAKSKTLGALQIPEKYFFDFLRGCFDGDGSFYSYMDPRWKSSFMFYTTFVSASRMYIDWLRKTIESFLHIKGHITKSKNDSVYQLKYAKAESLQLLPKMYYDDQVVCLTRKRIKTQRAIQQNLTT